MALLKMIAGRTVRSTTRHCFWMSVVVICGCSDFNRPIQPIAVFSDEAYCYDSEVDVGFSGRTILFTFWNRKIGSGLESLNANVYFALRKENEFITGNLSDYPIDFVAYANFAGDVAVEDRISTAYRIFNDGGDTLASGFTWRNIPNTAFLNLDVLPIPEHKLFFWQVEIYDGDDTLRLPEDPGIWYFNRCFRGEY